MNWTTEQLKEKGYTLAPDGHYYYHANVFNSHSRKLPDTITQHAPKLPLVKVPKAKATSKDCTAKCNPQYTLGITRFSTKTLDVDNLAGGCKPLIDQIRYAHLIPDDNPESVEITFAQVKVRTQAEQRTEVRITKA
jgi:Holliday junction resolvase RusA-like endonuclease